MALNNMSEELAESYAVLERRVQEKTAGLEQKNEIRFLMAGQPPAALQRPALRTYFAGTEWPAGLTLLRDIEVRVYDRRRR